MIFKFDKYILGLSAAGKVVVCNLLQNKFKEALHLVMRNASIHNLFFRTAMRNRL